MIRKVITSSLLALALAGCGKYAKPVPQDLLSPTAVESLQVVTAPSGVSLSWDAPNRDQRSKELRDIDGYRIYRKELTDDSTLFDTSDYQLIATVADNHLLERDARREEVRTQGKTGRPVKVEAEWKHFEFSDSDIRPGLTYVYEIVPFNQGNVEGEVRQLVKILFRGDASETSLVDVSDANESMFD